MPTVTYNGQSFAIDNRRFWIVGASLHYARIPAAEWAVRIAAARQAGFNTIETACPWSLHEPRRDRFQLAGQNNVREFISLCGKAGMKVILRPGPYIGSGYTGGGIPGWLANTPGVALREANEIFLERVNVYFRKLLGVLEDLQVTSGGPILLVQSEHAWLCSNRDQADSYLREVTRVIRESGFNVPTINANDFWQESPGTIDTWRGRNDLLGHLRQLRTVQPEAPRLLSSFDAASIPTWGQASDAGPLSAEPADVLHDLAQCLAAGAQAVVSPFHGGTNFGFLGGRMAGGDDRFVTTTAAAGPPLGEAGCRGDRYNALKRIATFASSFGHVFAELDPDHHPVVLDTGAALSSKPAAARKRSRSKADGLAVVSLRGSQGRVVFVFSDQPKQQASLLLDNGVRMPVNLGDQRVGWYVFDADINGSGRLDYANLCPYAIVGRATVVLQGPKGTDAFLSVNGTPLQTKVPGGEKPAVFEHKGITIIICNQQQIDRAYHDAANVYIGIEGIDDEGKPLVAKGSAAWMIDVDGQLKKLVAEQISEAPAGRRRTLALRQWQASSAEMYATGDSPRFATLDGPQTLTACGAQTGYGWYAIRFRTTTGRKRICHLPQSGDRVHLYLNGKSSGVVGVGHSAKAAPIELRLTKGDHVLVALADNLGRFAEGNDLGEAKGVFGHVYEVKQIRSAKPKKIKARAVDPFTVRGYLVRRSKGQLSDTQQVTWTFTHSRKTPIIVDICGADATGTLLLNDEPIAFYAGATGACRMTLVISRDENEAFKRGKNVLRFAPDARQDKAVEQLCKALTLYEATESLTDGALWSFAKWEPPITTSFDDVTKNAAKSLRGHPCWWRTRFENPDTGGLALWFDTTGLSKGQVFINGQNLGRYFTATATSKAVGPQTRLYIPASWLNADGENELLLFDEHGFDPCRTKLVIDAAGELD